MVKAQLLHTQVTRGRYRWLRIVALGSMMLASSLIFLRQGIFDMRVFGLVAIAYVAVVISEVSRHPMWIERSARRMFSRHLDKDQAVKFEIDKQGIRSSTEGVGENNVEWADIERVMEAQDGFLVYLNKQLFLWIPRSSFRPKSDIKRFRKLCEANGILETH